MQTLLNSPATAVIITGGASGIGRACAEALAAAGRPVAIWDLDAGRCAEVAQEIATRFAVDAVGQGIDLSEVEGIDAALSTTRETLPQLGGLVHAAGVSRAVPLAQLTVADWEAVLSVNLRALPFLVKALRGDFAAHTGSAVVAIASINATLGNAANPAYTASKGGVLAVVRSLADDLAGSGIRINSVSPGMIRTPMLEPALDNLGEQRLAQRIMLGRLGEPGEIARAVRFLLSDEAAYITASELVVDGGNIPSQRS